ncbi:MAG: hypothetical protein ACI4T9_11415, partial [Prevotella sp.]
GGLGAFGGFVIPPLMGHVVVLSPEHGYGLGFLIFTGLAILNIAILSLTKPSLKGRMLNTKINK